MPPNSILDTYRHKSGVKRHPNYQAPTQTNEEYPVRKSKFRIFREPQKCTTCTRSSSLSLLSRNLTSMLGDPILVNDQGGRIGRLRFGLGSLLLVVPGRVEERTSSVSGIVGWGRHQIEHEATVQRQAYLANHEPDLNSTQPNQTKPKEKKKT